MPTKRTCDRGQRRDSWPTVVRPERVSIRSGEFLTLDDQLAQIWKRIRAEPELQDGGLYDWIFEVREAGQPRFELVRRDLDITFHGAESLQGFRLAHGTRR